MPQLGARYGEQNFTLGKILAVVIIFAFLFFVLIIVIQWSYLSQMNEASEEVSGMMAETGAGGGGESISIIQNEMVPEIRLVYIVSLILFGLLDGIFAIMLWRGKMPKSNETILLPLVIVYALNRFLSVIVMTILPRIILVRSDSRALMNLLYLTIPVFSVVSLVIIMIVFWKVLARKKATKILYGIPDEAAF